MHSRAVEAKPIIQDGVQEFSDSVQEYFEEHYDNIPTTSIDLISSRPSDSFEQQITKPSKIVEETRTFKKSYFREEADAVIERDASFHFNGDRKGPKSALMREIFKLAKLTLDYNGRVEFAEDAFNSAYVDHFAPLYEHTHKFDMVFPLARVGIVPIDHAKGFQLALSPQKQSLDFGEKKVEIVDDLRISRLSDEEMSAVLNYGTPGMVLRKDRAQRRLGWWYALRMKIEVTHRPTKHSDEKIGYKKGLAGNFALRVGSKIAAQVLIIIRLWDPRKYAGLGPGYVFGNSWKYHRNICPDIERTYSSRFQQRGSIKLDDGVSVHEENAAEFQQFWNQFGPYCSFSDKHSLRSCLERFNRMYEKSSREDKVIDAYIGLETTLIRGDPSSVLATRAKTLLDQRVDYDEATIEGFIDCFNDLRNDIVHRDGTISDRDLSEVPNVNESREYIPEIRWYLAEVIMGYASQLSDPESSIQTLNVGVLDLDDQEPSYVHRLLSNMRSWFST